MNDLHWKVVPYERDTAVDYAHYWAYRRNPDYYDFHGLGGDCTNFVSQCLYAGSGIMNDTPTYGWYYRSLNDRAPAWTGVEELYRFLTKNQGAGPFASETEAFSIRPGDVIQMAFDTMDDFQHSMVVVHAGDPVSWETIWIATHSNDVDCRPILTYAFKAIRFLHIEGVRFPAEDRWRLDGKIDK